MGRSVEEIEKGQMKLMSIVDLLCQTLFGLMIFGAERMQASNTCLAHRKCVSLHLCGFCLHIRASLFCEKVESKFETEPIFFDIKFLTSLLLRKFIYLIE